jgi:hypothetical protein
VVAAQTRAKVKPSAWWYALPVALLVVALLLVALAVSRFVTFITADRVPYQPGQEITVDSDGFSVYSRSRSLTVDCTATGQGGQIQLDSESGITVSRNQDKWYVVASSPSDMPTGTYQLSCGSSLLGPANVFIGPRASFGSLAKWLVVGLGLPGLMLIAAFVSLLVIAVRRGRSKRSPLRPPAPGATAWAPPRPPPYTPPPPPAPPQ